MIGVLARWCRALREQIIAVASHSAFCDDSDERDSALSVRAAFYERPDPLDPAQMASWPTCPDCGMTVHPGDIHGMHTASLVWRRLEADPTFTEGMRQAEADLKAGRFVRWSEVRAAKGGRLDIDAISAAIEARRSQGRMRQGDALARRLIEELRKAQGAAWQPPHGRGRCRLCDQWSALDPTLNPPPLPEHDPMPWQDAIDTAYLDGVRAWDVWACDTNMGLCALCGGRGDDPKGWGGHHRNCSIARAALAERDA